MRLKILNCETDPKRKDCPERRCQAQVRPCFRLRPSDFFRILDFASRILRSPLRISHSALGSQTKSDQVRPFKFMSPAQNPKIAGAPAGLAVAFGRRQVSDPARSANTPQSAPSSEALAKEERRNQTLDPFYPVTSDAWHLTRSLTRAAFFLSPVTCHSSPLTRRRLFEARRGCLSQSRVPRNPSSITHRALGPASPLPSSFFPLHPFTRL